ncbi:integrase arm-type DNA-binding domain-containing protein [Niveibacterium sp. SC-1]|uniref:tyrosine-type recombinase/integrase n=1 Tax=Niveibacterium sp. SC-1 TaxID=3135646 RepID=UPI00311E25B1
MTFDARAAKLLQPGENLTSADHPGLRLSATATTCTWIYRYRSPVDDRLRQIRIGAWPAMSVHAAIAAWEGLRRRRELGEDPAARRKEARDAQRRAVEETRARTAQNALRVCDLVDAYWNGHVVERRKKKGATEVRRMFDTMLGEVAELPAAGLTRAQAFALIEAWARKAPVQAGKLRTELGAAWDYGHDSGRLPEDTPNWWRQVMRGRIKSRGKAIAGERVTTKRVLSEEEIRTVLRWLPNFSRLVADVLTLYLWTATRGAEIVAMRGDDLSVGPGDTLWWTIPKGKTKNAGRADAVDLRVPLFGRARLVVERRREHYGDGYLFPARIVGKPRPVDQKTIQTAVWTAQPYSTTAPDDGRPRLLVTHWAPHDLRRSARTMLAAMGCPGEIAEAILGHMPRGIVGVYNRHTYDAERSQWLSRLSDRLESLASR